MRFKDRTEVKGKSYIQNLKFKIVVIAVPSKVCAHPEKKVFLDSSAFCLFQVIMEFQGLIDLGDDIFRKIADVFY